MRHRLALLLAALGCNREPDGAPAAPPPVAAQASDARAASGPPLSLGDAEAIDDLVPTDCAPLAGLTAPWAAVVVDPATPPPAAIVAARIRGVATGPLEIAGPEGARIATVLRAALVDLADAVAAGEATRLANAIGNVRASVGELGCGGG